MPDDASPLDDIWSQAAVIPTTWRCDATDDTGNAVLYFVEANAVDVAANLFAATTGLTATFSAYTPTNLELQADWNAGGFTLLTVS
jgi:hypothetical protein